MRLDGKGLTLLMLTAVVLVILGFVAGRYSMQREMLSSGVGEGEATIPGAGESDEEPPAEVRSGDVMAPPSETPARSSATPAVRDGETSALNSERSHAVSTPAAPPPPFPGDGLSSSGVPAGIPPIAASRLPASTPGGVVAGKASSSRYLVQVYATEEKGKAEDVVGRLRGRGYVPEISPFTARGRTYYRVRVGPFATRDEARASASRVEREEGLKTWITQP